MISDQQMSNDKRKQYCGRQADHPDREEGANNIYRRRMPTPRTQQTKSYQVSETVSGIGHCFPLSCGCSLVAGGLVLSRFPVANSRSTASNKSWERAETPESRACANCLSAVSTSTRFFTPYLYASNDAE